MKDLTNAREEIDAIDEELSALFTKRMALSKEIALYKKEHHLPIFDAKREREVLEKEVERIQDPALKIHYRNFLQSLMNVSKAYQSEVQLSPKDIQINVLPSYVIHFGALADLGKTFGLKRKVLLLSDSGIPKEYLDCVASQGKEIYPYIIPQGEKSKSIESFQAIQSFMLEHRFTRKDCLLSLGGGVVGDLGGFVSSTYMRGITFYNVPTSFLSMIDSSIGGKTAIDFDTYKNVIGSFYQPKGVYIDVNLLKSLDPRQYNAGMGEAIKMAMILDKPFFEALETHQLSDEEIIHRSLILKKMVVEQDEKEGGLRKILNFGHTIGHAIEAEQAGKLFHGECVALGMIPFTKEKKRLCKVLESYQLPIKAHFDFAKIEEILSHDKKADKDSIDVILVDEIGTYRIESMSIPMIMEALKKGELYVE